MRIAAVLLAAVAVLFSSGALANIGAISLEELIAQSDVIIVAEVTDVSADPAQTADSAFPAAEPNASRTATATVLESWKGNPGDTVRFVASSSWACDTTDAKIGETVLLFLNHGRQGATPYVISHVGRGRMPLREVQGKIYATVWKTDVQLPEGIETIPAAEPEYSLVMVSVPIEALEQMVDDGI